MRVSWMYVNPGASCLDFLLRTTEVLTREGQLPSWHRACRTLNTRGGKSVRRGDVFIRRWGRVGARPVSGLYLCQCSQSRCSEVAA